MSIKDWLFSPAGAAWLMQEYVFGNRSSYELAAEKATYQKLIVRALAYHSLDRRSKSAAQSNALKTGRHAHPTKGKLHSDETKKKISKGVKKDGKKEIASGDIPAN